MGVQNEHHVEPYVFISYSHQNTHEYDLIKKIFTDRGVRYWSDDQIYHGEEWNVKIAQKITKAKVFLLLLSSDAASSRYVKDELYFARKHDIPISTLIIGSFLMPQDIEMMIGRWNQLIMKEGYEEELVNALPKSVFLRKPVEQKDRDGKVVRFASCVNCGGDLFQLRFGTMVPVCYRCGTELSAISAPPTILGAVNSEFSHKAGIYKPTRRIMAISGGAQYMAALYADGTVRCAGVNKKMIASAEKWTGIVAIAAGTQGLVGLKQDGTICSTNSKWNSAVKNWKNITAVAVGSMVLVGLRQNGTVVVLGSNLNNVSTWKNIIAIAAAQDHVVGLRADGCVVAAGSNNYGQLRVSDWSDIDRIDVACRNTYGVRRDGSVQMVGKWNEKLADLTSWTDIRKLIAVRNEVIGLRRDGTVILAKHADSNHWAHQVLKTWRGITDVVILDRNHFVGLRQDGTLVEYTDNQKNRCADALMSPC